ncbi:MAG: hypothetical protein M9962_08820 [Oligoflexia bacterium]|nr:hypothetical protein [Oligoflexia bacterium]
MLMRLSWKTIFLLSNALIGIYVWLIYHHHSLDTGFLREDARFVKVAPFSITDIFYWFWAPQNSMYQYRPVTKILWAIPSWLGITNIAFYHLITWAIIFLGAGAVFKILRDLKVHIFLALSGFFAFLFMPSHLKPLYWISAWHNSSVLTFSLWAIIARLQWHKTNSNKYRIASILFYFFALGSREWALLLFFPLLIIDYTEKKFLIRKFSLDILFIPLLMFIHLYVLHNPSAALGASQLEFGLNNIFSFWKYTVAIVFPEFDADPEFQIWSLKNIWFLLTCLLFILSLKKKNLWPFLATIFVSIIFHISLTNIWFLEYAGTFAACVFILWIYWINHFLDKFKAPSFIIAITCSLLITTAAMSTHPLAKWFSIQYHIEPLYLKIFLDDLNEHQEKLPAHRTLKVTGLINTDQTFMFGSLHWLADGGIADYIPNRFIFFDATGTWIETGFQSRKSDSFLPKEMGVSPIEIQYTDRGFQ